MYQDLQLSRLRLKDSDDNWLYGPVQSLSNSSFFELISEPTSTVSKSTCFLNKKSILKKRSMSELMRQKLMSDSLVYKWVGGVRVQHGNASVDRTQDCPMLNRIVTDSVIFAIRSESIGRRAADCFSS